MNASLNQKLLPIGLFDSGFGGLTVLKELVDLLPGERFIYFGDTARLPYGNKSPTAIRHFAFENAAFLLEKKIKLLVISCHTACAHAYSDLQNALPIPVLGVTAPGVDCLLKTTQTNAVAVLGTTSTINSGIIQDLLRKKQPSLQIYPIACPLFVPLVEEGLQSHPAAALIAEHYLARLRGTPIDSALLACTHYPLLTTVIQTTLGSTVKLITPAKACAEQVKQWLEENQLLNAEPTSPNCCFYVSDDPVKFQLLAKSFFVKPIEKVTLVQNKIL